MLLTSRSLFASPNICRKFPEFSLIFAAALLLALLPVSAARAADLLGLHAADGKPTVFTDVAGGTYGAVYGLGTGSPSDALALANAKADQTITFGPLSGKTFGDPDFTVSASASSGLPVSFTASGNCTVGGSTVHITGAGSCTVTASQGGDANFNPAPDVAQSFQIAKAGQTITFGALFDRRFGSFDFPVSATGGASGNPVTFSASGNCTIVSGNTVHITGAGSCSVTASQAGDSNYTAAADVTQSFQIRKASTITFLGSSPNPSFVGQTVTFSVFVGIDSLSPSSPNAVPTGTVQFQVDNNDLGGPINCAPTGGNLCAAGGVSTSAMTAGSHGIRAIYSGDANFNSSSLAIPQTVAPVVIKFSKSPYTVGERDGSATITVTRTGDITQAASIDYLTDDNMFSDTFPCGASTGLARERCDYTRAAGTLSFAPNETEKTFTVLVNDDSYAEGTETLSLSLSHPSSNAAAGQSATLQITDDQPESSGNPNDDAQTFVRQHYHDFLNREPDAPGLQFWTNQMTNCGASDTAVCRINVSAAFFLSIEFQQTGYLVERMYKVAYGDAQGTSSLGGTQHPLPVPVVRLDEFLRDTQEIGSTPTQVIVGQNNWQQQLDDNKNAFALKFVGRQRFTAAFPASMTADAFVNQLNLNAGGILTSSDIAQLDAVFGGPSASSDDAAKRARVLRTVAENATLQRRESDRAFVLMQFFGYLRRNPNDALDTDYTGYDFWLQKLGQFNGNFIQAEMVKAFVTSTEYRQRFGQ